MLTTLLSIGRTLRLQEGAAGKRHHRYIRQLPSPDTKKQQSIKCYEIIVADDMTFDLSERTSIKNQSVLESELFYLNYKTSSADTMKKYVFGDICRFQIKVPKEETFAEAEVNFTLGTVGAKPGNAFGLNSFDRAKPDAQNMGSASITAFRNCLESQMETLFDIFDSEKSVYINFRFGADKKHWYEMEAEMNALDAKMLKEFVNPVNGGYVLSKSLHKTLSADKGAMPQFSESGAFKTWTFPTLEDVSDLLYSIDFSQKALIRKGDIKIVVLPRGEENGVTRLSAEDIEDFFSAKGITSNATKEDSVADIRTPESDDEEDESSAVIFNSDAEELTRAYQKTKDQGSITQFDFIFSKASASPSSPDIDVIELAGVQRGRIGELHLQIKRLNETLLAERDEWFELKQFTLKKRTKLRIFDCFNDVLGDVGRDKKKYGSHLLKVLPQIYSGSYIQDDLLLPSFIDVIERQIRDGSCYYDFLRFKLFFLFGLQDVNRSVNIRKENEVLEKIKDSHSYKIGQLLGKMARPLRAKINSFEKNYVGLLSRRLAQLHDVVLFQNFINEKLIMHEVAYPNLKTASTELATLICNFSTAYNREECAFGFFESYFAPIPKKDEAATNDGNDNPSDSIAQNEQE